MQELDLSIGKIRKKVDKKLKTIEFSFLVKKMRNRIMLKMNISYHKNMHEKHILSNTKE